ncbi:MAG TPA: quinone-dependent dihydroorotate dehydrogenase [Trueperaceae bacterium]
MYDLLRPLLFAVDPELVHRSTLRLLGAGGSNRAALRLLASRYRVTDPRLGVERFGLRFPNPVGLAAGMDKDGVALPAWEALGFGFSEAGSVTAEAQEGNEGKRLFRLPRDGAIINRMGFNNAGAAQLALRLERLRGRGLLASPVFVNVGKSRSASLEAAAADYQKALEPVWPQADGIVVNVSSPNTLGLRTLQEPEALARLLEVFDERQAERELPVLLKLAPDLGDEQLREIAAVAAQHRVAGLVAVNTTVSRPGLSQRTHAGGGLSGRPLAPRALEVLRLLARTTDLPLVSVGGVFDSADVVRRLRAGASLVELYTGFVYGGPGTVRRILEGLLLHLEEEGIPDVESLIGIDRQWV